MNDHRNSSDTKAWRIYSSGDIAFVSAKYKEAQKKGDKYSARNLMKKVWEYSRRINYVGD